MRHSTLQAFLAPLLRGTPFLLVASIGSTATAQDPFGMLEAHGAMSAQAQQAADMHARYSRREDNDDRPFSKPSSAPGLTREEADALDAALREKEAQDAAELKKWQDGFWLIFQSRVPAPPGQFCAVMFQDPRGIITVTGLDNSWNGALLMFTGENVPKPRRFREITATLTQTGEPPANLRVFNYASDPRMNGMGTIVFAVPRLKDALDGIIGQQEFAVSVKGREVFRMSWKDGATAARGIRKCLERR